MTRLLGWSRSWLHSLLRFDPRVMRRMPAALLLIAAGLCAWVLELGAVLQGQAQVRNWSSTWVGLDLMEVTGLVLTAIMLHRRSVHLSPVAAVTATLFGLDAWFDVLTASAGAVWYESVATALFGEIPMTALLAALAIWAPRHITVHSQHQHRCNNSVSPDNLLCAPSSASTPTIALGLGPWRGRPDRVGQAVPRRAAASGGGAFCGGASR
jgi:hypothetical protein